MYCLFVSTSSCLLEGSCIVCSSLLPVVCRRTYVLFVCLYLQLFVGGFMYCMTNKQDMNPPTNNWR
jgi:hypothetical protein